MHVDVDQAGHPADALRNLGGNLIVRRAILSDQLNVDRGGQPEIKNLTHDVGRLIEKRQVGKFLREFSKVIIQARRYLKRLNGLPY